jgi:hypothetical protein
MAFGDRGGARRGAGTRAPLAEARQGGKPGGKR